MAIAVVVNDEGIVTPIVGGTTLRIINKDGTVDDFHNPALDLTEGRRGATLKKALEQGVTTFIAPPATFCELSYEKAQQEQVDFIQIEANQFFADVMTAIQVGKYKKTVGLPVEEILPSAPVAK